MILNKSAYNLYYKIQNNNTLVYNTLSGAILSIPTDFGNHLENQSFDSSGFSERTAKILLDNGILVEEHRNELVDIEQIYRETCKKNEVLNLFIILTLDCNFLCPYCYQNKTSQRICKSSSIAIIKFIYDYTENHKLNKININWFGGEPLLNKNAIYEISHAIKVKGLELTSTLNTNGYLLDNSLISDFGILGINELKITIDGTKTVHDSRRSLKNGQGTFSKIIENVNRVIDLYEKQVSIQISTNIDQNNIQDYPKFLEFMKPLRNKVVFSFERTRNNLGRGTGYQNTINQEEFNILAEQLYENLSENGFGSRNLPQRINCACNAELVNSFTLGPDLSIYKCASGINIPENRIGHLNRNGEMIFNSIVQEKWNTYDIFKDQECIKCLLLPLCMGGCPEKRLGLNPGDILPKSCYYDKNFETVKNRVLFCYNDIANEK